ncbi:MAG: M48 family metalloprotease [Gammaproteobacteria bacterium]|nr:M48 family metalloprotease [Gammaproteobacteria bacterium]
MIRHLSHFIFLSLLLSSSVTAETATGANNNFRQRISQTTLINDADIAEDIRAEISFGRELATVVISDYPLLENLELQRYLNLVMQRLLQFGDRQELTYHIAILNSDEVNAYTTPGGYIFVSRGALKEMQDEAELAAVIAHEIAHVNRRHIVNELQIRGEADPLQAGIGQFFAGFSDAARVALEQAIDTALDLLFGNGLKQADEFDADASSTLLLAQAGYDATALERYLQRIAPLQGESMRVLVTTHPTFADRISRLAAIYQQEGITAAHGDRHQQRFTRHFHRS